MKFFTNKIAPVILMGVCTIASCSSGNSKKSSYSRVHENVNASALTTETGSPNVIAPTKDVKSRAMLSQFLSIDSIIFLQTTQDAIIGAIDKVMYKDNIIFVLDSKVSKGLFAFRKSGEFLYAINRQGNDPGEVKNITDFTLMGNKVLLLNNRQQILSYNYNTGEFDEKVSIPFMASSIAADDKSTIVTLFNKSSKLGSSYNYHIIQINLANKKVTSKTYPLPDRDIRYESSFKLFSSESGIYFTREFDFNLYRLVDDKIEVVNSLDFGEDEVPESFIQKAASQKNFVSALQKSEYVLGPSGFMENPNYRFFGYTYKGTVLFYYLDKKANKVVNSSLLADDMFLGGFQPFPKGLLQDKLVFEIDPAALMNGIKHLESNHITNKNLPLLKKRLQNAYSFSEKVNMDSNPALALATLK